MTLTDLNNLDATRCRAALSKCCGAKNWIERMSMIFPVSTSDELYEKAEVIWFSCSKEDWLEAFRHHPRIGDITSLKKKFADTSEWAASEQSDVLETSESVLKALAEANKKYEEKFGYIFIVCATGKSANEMLDVLNSRLKNNPTEEIMIAMHEQNKITKLRLQKLLS